MTKPVAHKEPAGPGSPPPGAIAIKRPIDRADHPIESGNYRIGTPAIEAAYTLIKQCLSHRITGALIYGPSRIGKTRAIEYLRLLMAQQNPKVTTYHVQAEHKPKHAEGPFFTRSLSGLSLSGAR
jgi:midasin (ATPase involved in ribosome maturation)